MPFLRSQIFSVSEYKMSYKLVQNKNYIQNISLDRALLSVPPFIKNCDYFDMTSLKLLDVDNKTPSLVRSIMGKIKSFLNEDLMLVFGLVNKISNS